MAYVRNRLKRARSKRKKYAVRNLSGQPADLILTPHNRLAEYFREAGRVATPGSEPQPPTPEDIQLMIRVAKAFAYWLSSPGESEAITGYIR